MSRLAQPSPDPQLLRVFDPQAFAELTLRRPALQLEIAELFLSQGRPARARLTALAGQGREPFKDAIHALLGSARIVAAVQLCAVIDRAYAQGDWDRLPWREQLASAVGDAFDAFEPALLEFMAEAQRQV